MMRTYLRNFNIISRRSISADAGFFKKLMNNLQQELERNKELQENKKILEERLRQLSNSEVKKKFEKIEAEAAQSSVALANRLSEMSSYVNRVVTDVTSTKAAQEALKQAKAIAELVEKTANDVGDTQVYKQLASTAKTVGTQIDSLADVRMYSRPEELTMRSSTDSSPSRVIEPNTEAQEVQIHKDSVWYSGWNSFVNSNAYVNKLMDWKLRYDESDNVAVRMMRAVTDRVSHFMLSTNEISDVLTAIAKVDPSFDKTEWLRFCEKEIVPNILEACIRFDLEILKDWCLERAFNQLATPIKEYLKIGFHASDSQIIDLSKMEMISGKMMEHGPVIVISFNAYMIHAVKNMEGKVVEGNMDVPIRVRHVWILCRDMEEYDPKKAWKLLECHSQPDSIAI